MSLSFNKKTINDLNEYISTNDDETRLIHKRDLKKKKVINLKGKIEELKIKIKIKNKKKKGSKINDLHEKKLKNSLDNIIFFKNYLKVKKQKQKNKLINRKKIILEKKKNLNKLETLEKKKMKKINKKISLDENLLNSLLSIYRIK